MISRILVVLNRRPRDLQPGTVIEELLRRRAGNTGELVHNNPPRYDWHLKCPFCGCRSWFSFIEDKPEKQGDDVFECLRCMATSTRLDHVGMVDWKRMQAEKKARKP